MSNLRGEWDEEIKLLAYYKWEEAGRPEDKMEFWEEAEDEFYKMILPAYRNNYLFPFRY